MKYEIEHYNAKQEKININDKSNIENVKRIIFSTIHKEVEI